MNQPEMRISKLAYALSVSAVLMLLAGCRVHRPDDILSPRVMEKVLYDYHLAQAVVLDLPQDNHYERDAYLDWVYEKHGITKDEFEQSLVWYTRYPKEFVKVYQRLNARIDKDYKQAQKAAEKLANQSFGAESGDSVDLWYLDRTLLLNTSDFMNRVTFDISTDTTFHRNDTVRWNTSLRFIAMADSIPQTAYLALSVYYTDSISTSDTLISESGMSSLSLVLDSIRPFKVIRGSINYIDTTDTRSAIMAVPDVSLVRYHRRKAETSVPATSPEL